ncbi:hypothetical protein F3Y22_tig00111238pilonHSYRG00367 [Hibiscus syriacus]|uniref:Uncharacterized protein n=1 Tax=Hibiscus syriacus TaxID=106335 RepID=A0A6A2YTB2_HIBSY|nr:hypothetical protein F3Y22_tig00111238pilonHSYRG00367 [Hibiscus syriacus]
MLLVFIDPVFWSLLFSNEDGSEFARKSSSDSYFSSFTIAASKNVFALSAHGDASSSLTDQLQSLSTISDDPQLVDSCDSESDHRFVQLFRMTHKFGNDILSVLISSMKPSKLVGSLKQI